MKKLAKDLSTGNVVVMLSRDEWHDLCAAAAVPYDKQQDAVEISAAEIRKTTTTLAELKTFRKEIGAYLRKWDTLANNIDAAIAGKED
jgi:hypothetical protein